MYPLFIWRIYKQILCSRDRSN